MLMVEQEMQEDVLENLELKDLQHYLNHLLN